MTGNTGKTTTGTTATGTTANTTKPTQTGGRTDRIPGQGLDMSKDKAREKGKADVTKTYNDHTTK